MRVATVRSMAWCLVLALMLVPLVTSVAVPTASAATLDPQLTATETHMDVSCFGAADGSIDLTVSGGTAPYTYLWSPGGETTEDLFGLGPGTYSVTVMDADLADTSLSVTIMEPPKLFLFDTTVYETCFGALDGYVDLIVVGGTPGYSYLWSPGGETTQDLYGLGPGTYTVTVSDTNDCTAILSTYVGGSPEIVPTATHVDVTGCAGDLTGSIDLSVSGGVPGYSFSWSPGGETTEDLTGIAAGTHTVVVRDNNGCTAVLAVLIKEPPALFLTERHDNVACNGGSTGSIDLSVSGGTPGSMAQVAYTADNVIGAWWVDGGVPVSQPLGPNAGDWEHADNSTVFLGTGPSQLVFEVVNLGGPASGTNPAGFLAEITGAGVSGSLLSSPSWEWADATGGVPGDFNTLTWVPMVTEGTNAPADPNIWHNVTGIADAAEWVWTGGPEEHIFVRGQITNSSTYTYLWSPGGETTEDLLGLAPGTYGVTVTDGNGCTDTLSVAISEPPALMLSETHGDVSCNGGSDGSIDLSVSGGTPGYSYLWSPGGETSEDLMNLPAGTYSVTVRDLNGCTDTLSATIAEPPPLVLDETHVDVALCYGDSTGSIDLIVSGGTPGYSYSWSPGGETTEDLSGLAAGTYSVAVTDSNGCMDSLSVTIKQPDQLMLTASQVNVSCPGEADGSIDLSVSGGMPGYDYSWSPNGETTEDLLGGLAAGTYTVTVTDSKGCVDSLGVTITEPDSLKLTETHVSVACKGDSTGSIDLTVTGGTGSYFYLWIPNGESTEDLTGLAAGTYLVIVSDSCYSAASLLITIDEPANALDLSATHENVTCKGAGDGSIDLSVSGGTPGYTYLWMPGGATTEDLSGLGAGTYMVTVTDTVGCTDTLSVAITRPDGLLLTDTHVDVAACHGDSTGSIDLSVSGGTPGYTYLWSPGGETTEDLTNIPAGLYIVTVTDDHDCTESRKVTLTEPDSLVLTAKVTDTGCPGTSTGEIDLSASGGTPGYNYLWSPNGETSEDLSSLGAGTYTVVVTDANGCVDSLSVKVDSLPATLTIMATVCQAGGGTIDPSGAVLVPCGGDTTFTFTPDGDFVVLDVLVDGFSVGNPGTYQFTNVQADHIIEVCFDQKVATLLSLFSANPVAGGIEVRWQLGDPQAFAQVMLDRSEAAQGPWTRVSGRERMEGGASVVLDEGLTAGVTYTYRLTATTRNGRSVTLGQLSGTAGERITAFALASVWPNPVRGTANIEFSLPQESQVRLSVLDIQGREIAVIADGSYPAGKYQAVWSGETERGAAAPSGVYFLRFQSAAGTNLTQRMVLAR